MIEKGPLGVDRAHTSDLRKPRQHKEGEVTAELVREPGLASPTLWPGHPFSGSLQAQLVGPYRSLRGTYDSPWCPSHQGSGNPGMGSSSSCHPATSGGELLSPHPLCCMVTWAGTHGLRAGGIGGRLTFGLEGCSFPYPCLRAENTLYLPGSGASFC